MVAPPVTTTPRTFSRSIASWTDILDGRMIRVGGIGMGARLLAKRRLVSIRYCRHAVEAGAAKLGLSRDRWGEFGFSPKNLWVRDSLADREIEAFPLIKA